MTTDLKDKIRVRAYLYVCIYVNCVRVREVLLQIVIEGKTRTKPVHSFTLGFTDK